MNRLTKGIKFPDGSGTIDFADGKVREFLIDHKAGVKALFEALAQYEDLEEQALLLKLPCKVGDTVYGIVLCDDGVKRIVLMRVRCIVPFDAVHKVYLEDDHTKAYRSFYDFGRTVFLTMKEAEQALGTEL